MKKVIIAWAAIAVAGIIALIVVNLPGPKIDDDRLQHCIRIQAIQLTNTAYSEEQVQANFEQCKEENANY